MKNIMNKLKKIALSGVLISSVAIGSNYIYKEVIDFKKIQEVELKKHTVEINESLLNITHKDYITSLKNTHLELIKSNKDITYEDIKKETINKINKDLYLSNKIDNSNYENEIEKIFYEENNLNYLKYVKNNENNEKVFDTKRFYSNADYLTELFYIKNKSYFNNKLDEVKSKTIIKSIVINESQFNFEYEKFQKNVIKDIVFLTKMFNNKELNINNINVENEKINYISKYEKEENNNNLFNNSENNNFYEKFKTTSELSRQRLEFESLVGFNEFEKTYQYDIKILDKNSKIQYLNSIKKFISTLNSELKEVKQQTSLSLNN